MRWHGSGRRRVKHPPVPRIPATGNARSLRPPCVVIDTNLVLSALVFAQGWMTPLRHAWQSERYQPMVSRVTAAELIRILAYLKFKLSPDEQ